MRNGITLKGCILIFLLILAVCPGFGAEKNIIYLAPNGLDSNSGTKEKPLVSLTGARDFIRKLDTKDTVHVKIASGDYIMTSPLELTSRDATPILFEGVGANVTFYGGVPLTDWEKVSDGLWRASASGLCGGNFTIFS